MIEEGVDPYELVKGVSKVLNKSPRPFYKIVLTGADTVTVITVFNIKE
jgi:hypothetical protein